jgi:hypothetical protein
MANEFVVRNGLIAQANSQITGSLIVSNGITGSLQGTASYASQALSSSFATNANTANTASYVLNAVSASYATQALSASFASNALIATSSSYATTSSFASTFTVAGTLTAQTLNVQTVSSSVIYSSGSNVFGNSLTNTQTFTGSILTTGSIINTGGTFTFTGSYGRFVMDPTTPTGPFGNIFVNNSEEAALSVINATPGGWAIYADCVDNNAIIATSISGSGLSANSNISTAIIGQSTTGDLLELVGNGGSISRFTVKNNGNTRISGSLAVGNLTGSAVVGRIDATNDVVAFSTSDIRFKENINPINNALDKIDEIGGYTFDWKTNQELVSLHGHSGHDVGVIAHEIESILPEVVTTRDNGYKAVKYEKIVPFLIQCIKELKDEIRDLKSQK